MYQNTLFSDVRLSNVVAHYGYSGGTFCLSHRGERINCMGKTIQNRGKERTKVGTRVNQLGDNGHKSEVEVVGTGRAWLEIDGEKRGRYCQVGNKRRRSFRVFGCN
jgi:hypothetical protein